MIDVTVASRYAKALFIVAEKRGEIVPALEDLKGVTALVAAGTRIGGFLQAPQVRLADKRALLRRGLDGKALPVVALFADLLLRKKRLALLPAILPEYEALVEHAQGVQRAHVVSARALEAAESTKLHAALERYTQSRVKLTSEVDPELLGGALVKIGDHVIDRSVRTLLHAIETQLAEVSV